MNFWPLITVHGSPSPYDPRTAFGIPSTKTPIHLYEDIHILFIWLSHTTYVSGCAHPIFQGHAPSQLSWRGWVNSKSPNVLSSKVQKSRSPKVQEFRSIYVQKSKSPKSKIFRPTCPKVQKLWTFGLLDFWTFGLLDFRAWDFWTSGLLDLWSKIFRPMCPKSPTVQDFRPICPKSKNSKTWTFGILGFWTFGLLGCWTSGPVVCFTTCYLKRSFRTSKTWACHMF